MTEWVGTDHFPMSMPEACFQYNVDLYETEYFWQDKFSSQTFDNIYWISIKAIYPGDVVVPNPWGWKTRPAHWMDDAVRMECTDSSLPGQLVCNYVPLENPMTSESMDLAFQLNTDPNWIKWEQPFTGLRNWKHYEDQISMVNIDATGDIIYTQLVADDWLCTKRTPVTAIVWWDSYLGYRYQPCGSGTPQPPPVTPDAFLISIWTDVPANPDGTNPFSHPGRKIWEYMANNYDEVLVGCDKYPEGSSGAREPVYRYSVRLPGERWFRQRKINQIYWISIVAVYQATSDPTYKWGWTNHRHVFQDDAVAGTVLAGGLGWDWRVLYDQTGKSADQSFVLFTDPGICVSCPDYDWNDIVNFKDFADFADQWMWLGLPGGFSDSDLNCDGAVNCEDLKILCDLWLISCPLPTP